MKKIIVILLCVMLMISLGLNTFIMMYTSNKKTESEVVEQTETQPTEFEKRVSAYSEANPDLDETEVEKRVSMNLDKTPYEDATKVENVESTTVLVNAYNYLDADYEPSTLAFMYEDTINGKNVYLASEAKDAYMALYNYCAENGIEMSLVSGYASYKEVEDAFNLNNALIRPGFDDKQTGLTCDVTFDTYLPMESITENSFYPQFLEHMHEYGFVLRYPEDKQDYTLVGYKPYTIRYVGVDAATEMYNNNLCLEEYVCLNK